MRRLRVSAINFLNTAPLMWDFDHGEPPRAAQRSGPAAPLAASEAASPTNDFEVSYTIPSRCAEELKAGVADIGIIPAFTYATIPDLVILPDVAIAAKGPVRSILLVSKKPLEQIRTVATDTSSRSSVALLEVLFRKFLGGPRQLTPKPPELEAMLAACDAALLIGYPALRVPVDGSRYLTFDLAELWKRHTGLPFVFAFWALRGAALEEMRPGLDPGQAFRDSRQHGLSPENREHLVRRWAPHVGISEDAVRQYVTRHIYYYLDAECLSGLELFFHYAAECGLIPQAPELRFFSAVTA